MTVSEGCDIPLTRCSRPGLLVPQFSRDARVQGS